VSRWRQTTFTWQHHSGVGLREEAARDGARVVCPVNVLPGTFAARWQAQLDFLGYNIVEQAVIGGVGHNYISRVTPLDYEPPGGPVLQAGDVGGDIGVARQLWCSSLTGGEPVGVGVLQPGTDKNDYNEYRYLAAFTPRVYRVREDPAVLAQAPPAGLTASPLYDPGPPAGGYPDEGDALRRGWKNTRFVERRILPKTSMHVLKGGFLLFQSDLQPVRQGFPFPEYTETVVYTWRCVPFVAIPRVAMARCGGRVNEGVIGTAAQAFDGFWPGTLCFLSAEMEVYNGPLGDLLADISYVFEHAPAPSNDGTVLRGHNAVLRNAGGGVIEFQTVSADGGALTQDNAAFKFADFTALFRPEGA
jgi:hypothetical protein